MRPAFMGYAIGLALLSLISFRSPAVIIALIVPLIIFIYGLVAEEPALPPGPDGRIPGQPDERIYIPPVTKGTGVQPPAGDHAACPACHAQNPAKNNFCSRCGTRIR